MGWKAFGALVGGASQLVGQDMANDANSAQAKRQMDFQREMSNTAHVREVRDLRNAGLNPILSAQKGASSPPGAQARMENVMKDTQANAMTKAQLRNLNADTMLKDSNSALNAKNLSTGGKVDAEIKGFTDVWNKYLPKAKDALKSYKTNSAMDPQTIHMRGKTTPHPKYSEQFNERAR